MTTSAAGKLLDPTGEEFRTIANAKGRRGAGRLAVTVLWPDIEKALNAGATVTMVWQALSKQGLVSIQLRSFTRQVKARREGLRGAAGAAKPAAEALVSSVPVVAVQAPEGGTSLLAPAVVERSETRSGLPERPWRKGPHVPPDPHAVYRPRDPLAEDNS